ncbi:MAG: MarR family winged helix-turn-helix transcriptional regulator [Pseudonocardia sp.]|nr:MarR family winged helix-turn-helix transcriptional regulator [Pseudonocardia sp.]
MTTPPTVTADLGWALGRVLRTYITATNAALSEVPGGPRGYQVLAAAAADDTGSQLALAQKLGVDRTVMTYLIDDLESASLVERRPDPADRRTRRIILTERGQARLCQLERDLRRVEEHILAPLEPHEQDVLRGLLQRVATQPEARDFTCTEAEQLTAPPVRPRRSP